MTDGQFDVRPILVVLVIIVVLLASAQTALAEPQADAPRIDEGLAVVSSTVLGEETFTMTAWNTTLESIDVRLAPPLEERDEALPSGCGRTLTWRVPRTVSALRRRSSSGSHLARTLPESRVRERSERSPGGRNGS